MKHLCTNILKTQAHPYTKNRGTNLGFVHIQDTIKPDLQSAMGYGRWRKLRMWDLTHPPINNQCDHGTEHRHLSSTRNPRASENEKTKRLGIFKYRIYKWPSIELICVTKRAKALYSTVWLFQIASIVDMYFLFSLLFVCYPFYNNMAQSLQFR